MKNYLVHGNFILWSYIGWNDVTIKEISSGVKELIKNILRYDSRNLNNKIEYFVAIVCYKRQHVVRMIKNSLFNFS